MMKELIFIAMFKQQDLSNTKVITKFSESFYWFNDNKKYVFIYLIC